MKLVALATASAIALSLAAPAFANNAFTNDHLSTAEQIELQAAKTDNDGVRVRQILRQDASTTDSRTSAGHVQLAAGLGVDPADYSTADLIELRAAHADNDGVRVRQILERGGNDGVTVSTKSGVSSGHEQLARSMGVDAADFSTAQLIELRAAKADNDGLRVRQILREVN